MLSSTVSGLVNILQAVVLRPFFSNGRVFQRGFNKSLSHRVSPRLLFCEDVPRPLRPGLVRRRHIAEGSPLQRKRQRSDDHEAGFAWLCYANLVCLSCSLRRNVGGLLELDYPLQAAVAEWEQQKRQRINNIARTKDEPEYQTSDVIGPRERTPDPLEPMSRRSWNMTFRRWKRGWKRRAHEEVVDLTADDVA